MKTTLLAAAAALLFALATSAAQAAPSIAVSGALQPDADQIEPVTYGWHKGCHWHWGYRHCHWSHPSWRYPAWGYRRWGQHYGRHQHWSGWRSYSRY
jgi:hypothetical protein